MKFVFTRSGTMACRIIRAIDGGEWSHCAIIDGSRTIEATYSDGVRERSLAGLLSARPQHRIVELALPKEAAALKFAREQLGKPYDTAALPSLAIRRVFGTGPMWADEDAWYCAEHILAACAIGGRAVRTPLRRNGVEDALRHILGGQS